MLKGAPHQPKISMVDLNNYLPSIARETPMLHHCVHHFSLTPTFCSERTVQVNPFTAVTHAKAYRFEQAFRFIFKGILVG